MVSHRPAGEETVYKTSWRNRVAARAIVVVAFMVVWGAVTLITAWNDKRVPPEYWTVPALGIGGILGAFATLGENKKRRVGSRDEEEEDR